MNEPVTIAIPETGRMAQETLEWLAQKGFLESEWKTNAVEALGKVRKQDSEPSARQALQKEWLGGMDGITLKYDLRSGWRIAVSAKAASIADPPAKIYGSQYPTISGIREGLVDAAVTGLDDLFAAMLPYIARGRRPTRWDRLNAAIWPQNSTDVRVIGSTGISDYAGICLLAATNGGNARRKLQDAVEGRMPVYVKGRNQGLAYYLLGRNTDARPTEEIEEAVTSDRCFGFDVVRTGKTAAEKELYVLPPLLFTFSVIAVDIAKYTTTRAVRSVIEKLNPVVAPQQDYLKGRKEWENAVTKTLGKLWVGK